MDSQIETFQPEMRLTGLMCQCGSLAVLLFLCVPAVAGTAQSSAMAQGTSSILFRGRVQTHIALHGYSDYQQASMCLRGGMAVNTPSSTREKLAFECRREAQDLLAAGQAEAAMAAYEKAVDAAPMDAECLVALGRLLDQVRGNKQDAFNLFVRAVGAAPSDPVALSNYAFGLENWCGRLRLAEDAYRRAEALDPKNVAVLVNLASLLEQPLAEKDGRYEDDSQGMCLRHQQAHELYARALALEPNNRNTLCNYAGMLMTYGDMPASVEAEPDAQRGGERAATMLARALSLAPDDAAVLINYGVLMEDWGDNKQLACQFYRRAVAADPMNSAAVCSLTRLLRILKRLPEAEQVARAAVARFPADSDCADVIEIERELWRVQQTAKEEEQNGGGKHASSDQAEPSERGGYDAHPKVERDTAAGETAAEESGEEASDMAATGGEDSDELVSDVVTETETEARVRRPTHTQLPTATQKGERFPGRRKCSEGSYGGGWCRGISGGGGDGGRGERGQRELSVSQGKGMPMGVSEEREAEEQDEAVFTRRGGSGIDMGGGGGEAVELGDESEAAAAELKQSAHFLQETVDSVAGTAAGCEYSEDVGCWHDEWSLRQGPLYDTELEAPD